MRSRRCAILLLLASVLGVRAETTTINGMAYVPLSRIAAEYGMNAPALTGPMEFTASGGGHSLAVKSGSRQVLIDGIRHWLSYPAAMSGNAVFVSETDLAKTIGPAMRPGSVKGFRPVTTVVLDPGHGGHDRGARSSFGYEKEFALDVSSRVKAKLEKAGLKVVMTRRSDVFIPLESRPALARKWPNPIFVSIHFNSSDANTAANGIEVFAIAPLGAPPSGQAVPRDRDRQREAGHALEPVNLVLASTVHHALLGRTASFDRGVKRARFVVLKEASMPAVLIEGGFLTNPAEASRIASPAWRDALADGIVTGILEYKKLAEQGTVPRKAQDFGRSPTTQFVPEN